jgi:hypothetical protein
MTGSPEPIIGTGAGRGERLSAINGRYKLVPPGLAVGVVVGPIAKGLLSNEIMKIGLITSSEIAAAFLIHKGELILAPVNVQGPTDKKTSSS